MLVILLLACWFWIASLSTPRENIPCYKAAKALTFSEQSQLYPRNRKKLQWVINEVLYLKVISNCGCGEVAEMFNIWYNQLRTHVNIGEFTPKEIWRNKRDLNYDDTVLATAWDGVLTGYYFPD